MTAPSEKAGRYEADVVLSVGMPGPIRYPGKLSPSLLAPKKRLYLCYLNKHLQWHYNKGANTDYFQRCRL
jgi:hypothetical protein